MIRRAERADSTKPNAHSKKHHRAIGSFEGQEDEEGTKQQELGDEDSASKAGEFEVMFHWWG